MVDFNQLLIFIFWSPSRLSKIERGVTACGPASTGVITGLIKDTKAISVTEKFVHHQNHYQPCAAPLCQAHWALRARVGLDDLWTLN